MGSPSSSADLRLAVLVQHHPARAHLLDALLPALGACEVVTDPQPNERPSAIRTYLACLAAFPAWASHLLVIQDDAVPCADFPACAEDAVAVRPDVLLAFFLAGAPIRSARLAMQAHRRGESWTDLHRSDWVPTVALCWPRDLAERFRAFVAERPQVVRVGDDSVVGEWRRAENLTVAVAVPSLVEHPDREPSLIGRKASGGANRMRVAAVPPVVTSAPPV